jgi:hypothetical protein
MVHNSNYTGRAARSMNEAFGPYSSSHIEEVDLGADWPKVLVIVCAMASTVTSVLLILNTLHII